MDADSAESHTQGQPGAQNFLILMNNTILFFKGKFCSSQVTYLSMYRSCGCHNCSTLKVNSLCFIISGDRSCVMEEIHEVVIHGICSVYQFDEFALWINKQQRLISFSLETLTTSYLP